MNFNKLTSEFKIFSFIYGAMVTLSMIILGFELLTDLQLNILILFPLIASAFVARRDEMNRNTESASGYWSILGVLWLPAGIVYPILVSIKEKSWNSILWFVCISAVIPVGIMFVLGLLAEMFGIA